MRLPDPATPTTYGNLRMHIGTLSSASVALSHSSDDTTLWHSHHSLCATGGPLG